MHSEQQEDVKGHPEMRRSCFHFPVSQLMGLLNSVKLGVISEMEKRGITDMAPDEESELHMWFV